MAHSVHTAAHDGAVGRAEDGKILLVLIGVLCWLIAMMTLPIWLPALASALTR